MDRVARGAAPAPQVDIVSGATVTVLVMGDSIVRSATKLIRSGRLGSQGNAVAGAAPQAAKTIDPGKSEIRDWQSLVGDGSVRRLILTVADVNKAFEKSGNAAAAAHPEEGDPDDTFIDLYVADVAVPTIGRSLLGDDGYNRLAGRLKPGQQALVVAGSGRYSFKGAAYVRGGIFDRIELIQDTNSIRFRDRDHTRLGRPCRRRRARLSRDRAVHGAAGIRARSDRAVAAATPGAARGRHPGKGLAHLRSRLHAAGRLHEARAGAAGPAAGRRAASGAVGSAGAAQDATPRRPSPPKTNRCG